MILLIGGDVAQIRQRLEPFHEPGDPGGQIVGVGGFHAVLILRATDAIFHSQVLHSLHEQLNPFNGLHFVGEPANDCRDIVRALIARLDVDLNAPAIRRHVRAVDADERGEAHHLGILQDHARELPLLLGHAFEGSGLRSLRNTQDHSGILHREKALGHDHVHIEGQNQRTQCDEKGDGLMTQHAAKCGGVAIDDPLPPAFGDTIKRSLAG